MRELRQERVIDRENEEENESSFVASEKLERLMGEDFTAYAIRFVNLLEYRQILAERRFPNGLAFVPEISAEYSVKVGGTPYKTLSFKDYVSSGKKDGWYEIIDKQTDWPQSALALILRQHILEVVIQARKDVKAQVMPKGEYRRKVLEKVRDVLKEEVEKEQLFRYDLSTTKDIEHWMDYFDFRQEPFFHALNPNAAFNSRQYTPEELDRLALIRRWFDDPMSVDLRSFIRALEWFVGEPMANREEQYQLALVIDARAIDRDAEKKGANMGVMRGWGAITEENGRYPEKYLLGVIVIIPDKEILQQVVGLASHGGPFAHPIFDQAGSTRYPRPE